MGESILSVRQLNLYVRSLIEGDPRLVNVTVTGELSNFKNHYSSGHWYFTLKDSDATIRCVMFKGNAQRVKFEPYDGLKVILKGRVSLYEKDGQYQFYAEQMSPEGLGDITLKFEQIKAKLLEEGLFDEVSKRALPPFPKKIAVVTSPTGAAVQDILNILGRRWPLAEVTLCPVSVQGELAIPEMLSALDKIYAASFADVIIIGRGGGSIEDLWAFNSEELARKIYESPVPVISAVGHETDFTICDFVADLRAPTPSAAAELAVPDRNAVLNRIESYSAKLKTELLAKYNLNNARLEALLNSKVLKKPLEGITERRFLELDLLVDCLNNETNSVFENRRSIFLQSVSRLDALSPLKVLSRGYAAVQKQGKAVNSVSDLKIGDNINLRVLDGSLECDITKITKEKVNE